MVEFALSPEEIQSSWNRPVRTFLKTSSLKLDRVFPADLLVFDSKGAKCTRRPIEVAAKDVIFRRPFTFVLHATLRP